MSTCEGNLEGSTPPPEPPFLLAFRQSTSSCFRVSFISLARSPSQTCQVCNPKFNEGSRSIQRVLLKLHAKTVYISNLVLLSSMGFLVILSVRGGYKAWKPSKFVCNATSSFPVSSESLTKKFHFEMIWSLPKVWQNFVGVKYKSHRNLLAFLSHRITDSSKHWPPPQV